MYEEIGYVQDLHSKIVMFTLSPVTSVSLAIISRQAANGKFTRSEKSGFTNSLSWVKELVKGFIEDPIVAEHPLRHTTESEKLDNDLFKKEIALNASPDNIAGMLALINHFILNVKTVPWVIDTIDTYIDQVVARLPEVQGE